MYDTGTWRRELVRRHPETANARYLAPPLAVLGVLAGSCLGLLGVLFDSRLLRLSFLAPAGYLALIIGGSVATGAADVGSCPPAVAAGVGGDPSLRGVRASWLGGERHPIAI